MHVFWIEGLPGSGKSTLVNSLQDAYTGQAIIFPKTDLVSVFVSGLKFDFRKYMKPGIESDIVIEKLKTTMLNSTYDEQHHFFISERSFISTLVYYNLILQENKFFLNYLNKFEETMYNIERNFIEHFIYLECSPKTSLSRDTKKYTNFWNNFNRLNKAIELYKMYISREPSFLIIDTSITDPTSTLRSAINFISNFITT